MEVAPLGHIVEVSADQVVVACDLMTVVQEGLDKMTTKEPGYSGDENPVLCDEWLDSELESLRRGSERSKFASPIKTDFGVWSGVMLGRLGCRSVRLHRPETLPEESRRLQARSKGTV